MPPLPRAYRPRLLAVDTETTGLDFHHGAVPYLVTITDGDKQQTHTWRWSVDWKTREIVFPPGDVREILRLIDSADWLVLQNAKFDVAAFRCFAPKYQWPWNKTHDTLLAGHLLESGKPHDLTSMALDWLGLDIEPYEVRLKEETLKARHEAKEGGYRIAAKGDPMMPSAKEKTWKYDCWIPGQLPGRSDQALLDYANADSQVTWALWERMSEEIEQRKLGAIYEERRKIGRIIHEMEQRGVGLNRKRLEELQERYSTKRDELTTTIKEIALRQGFDLVLPKSGNNKSLLTFSFDVLKLPVVVETETGKPSFNKEAVDIWQITLDPGPAKDFVDALAEKRKLDTSLAYLDQYERFWLPVTGDHDATIEAQTKAKATTEVPQDRSAGQDAARGGDRATTSSGRTGSRRGAGRYGEDAGIPPRLGGGSSEGSRGSTLAATTRSDWYKLYPSLNPTGTATLRCSSANPNEQNISKKKDSEGSNLRYCFGPLPGREWWSLDAENIELRLPAYESGEEEMIALFERPDAPPYFGSNHLLTAHVIWKKEFELCRDKQGRIDGRIFKERYDDTLYQWTKNGNFAVLYGAINRSDGAGTADQAYHLPGAQSMIESRFTKMAALNRKWIAFANKHGYVETIPDRSIDPHRGYPLMCARSEYGKILPTVPLNYHVQGSAMWWTLKGMVRCSEYLDDLNERTKYAGWIVMQVHDEIVFDLPKRAHPLKNPKSSNLRVVRRLAELMRQGGEDYGIPTPVGVKYHPVSWADGIRIAL